MRRARSVTRRAARHDPTRGRLALQTLDRLTALERDDRFANVAGEWSFWRTGNPYGVRSWREQNAEETGLPIWRMLYRRNS